MNRLANMSNTEIKQAINKVNDETITKADAKVDRTNKFYHNINKHYK